MTSVLPTYRLSNADTAGAVCATYWIRQKPWKCALGMTDYIVKTGRLHAPWAHSKAETDAYAADPAAFLASAAGPARTFCTLPTGTVVILPAKRGRKGLLMRLVDEPAAAAPGICAGLAVERAALCHPHVVSGCATCRAGIAAVFDCTVPEGRTRLDAALATGRTLEPFWSIERRVEVLGYVDAGRTDWRHIAAVPSVGHRASWWVRV